MLNSEIMALEFPEWAPLCLVDIIKAFSNHLGPEVEISEGIHAQWLLLTDPRMEEVWSTFTKKKGENELYDLFSQILFLFRFEPAWEKKTKKQVVRDMDALSKALSKVIALLREYEIDGNILSFFTEGELLALFSYFGASPVEIQKLKPILAVAEHEPSLTKLLERFKKDFPRSAITNPIIQRFTGDFPQKRLFTEALKRSITSLYGSPHDPQNTIITNILFQNVNITKKEPQ